MRTATLLQTELDGEPCTDRVLALLDRWDHDDRRPVIKSLTEPTMTTTMNPTTNGHKAPTPVLDLTAAKDQAKAARDALKAAEKAEAKAARKVEGTSKAHNDATADLDTKIADRRAKRAALDAAEDAVRLAQRKVNG